MKEHVDKISRSAFYYLRQLRVIRKSLTTKPWSMRLFPAGWIIAIVCYTVLAKHCWIDYSQFFAPPPVSCFANSSMTRSLPIYETDFTGFPWSKESSSRFACSFSSADSTRLQSTSPRCCIRSNARRDTTSVLIRDSTMTFLDVRPFAPDLAVLLFAVRHSGTVCRTLWKIVFRWMLLRPDSKLGYLRKHLDNWNCVSLAVNCIFFVRTPAWWLTTIRERHWNKYYITLLHYITSHYISKTVRDREKLSIEVR